ncbi:MAG TPA: haloacid dehalogenase-like hydrolase, partial [Gammaproteobacteria bacterium]|nr:haloacid dehalogenase-like hydrolase [Gammaproteobacteria bacterium]
MKLAVFDIDGTLVRGASERMFWWYLLRRGRQGPRQLFAFLLFMLRYLPTGGIQTPRKNKAYLSGLRVEEVDALAR